MNNSPTISVVVPVYNVGTEFCNTIKSVLAQTYADFELIVVDDGSENDVSVLLFGFNDSRIKFHKLESNTNANVARNYGINIARGEYIAMLDAGNLWSKTHLQECLQTLQNTTADGLYGSLGVMYPIGRISVVTARLPRDGETMIDYLLKTGCGAQTSTLFFTADSIKDVLFDPELKRHQDYDLVVRYSKKYRFAVKENATAIYHSERKNRHICLDSCIRFISSVRDEISHDVYSIYTTHMLRLAYAINADSKVILHYQNELKKL